MYIDSHLHLTSEYYEDLELFIQKSKDQGVDKLILSCNSLVDIKEGIELTKKHDNIYLTIGFAPHYLEEATKENFIYLNELAKDPKVIGIGEIGLDYYWTTDNVNFQKEIFINQLEIAKNNNLPVVIHTRKAFLDTYNLLKEYEIKGVIHCFEGTSEEARQFIEIGFHLGIGGLVTFKKHDLKDVILDIDLKNIVLETDSPYLSPEPFRGRTNGSWNIPIIAQKIADLKNTPLEDVIKTTTGNVLEIFDLK